MPSNITGRSGVNGTNTNVVITNRMLATEPLEMTQTLFTDPIVLSLKGITGFTGSGGNVLKSNSANNALEWGVDNNEVISVALPLQKVGSTISLTGLNTLSSTDANKVIKVNSAGTALIYDNDDGSNWILSNNNLYPLSTGTNLVVGSTINSSTTRKLFVNGTADINGDLFFNGDDETYIDADSKSLRNYAGYVVGSIGGQHKFYVKQSSSTDLVASLRTGALTLYGESNMNSGLSKLELIASGSQQFRIINNNGGGSTPNISFESETVGNTIDPYYYSFTFDTSERYRFTKNGGITIGEWKATAIGVSYGGTGLSTLSANKILQVNSGGTGFNQVSIPVVQTYTAGTLINVSASNVISFTGTIPVYTAGTLISVNSNIISFTGTIPTNNNTLINGAGYITSSSIPTAIWSLNGSIIGPAVNANNTIQLQGTSSVIGSISNPSNSLKPYIKFGSFETLYGYYTRHIQLSIESHTNGVRNVLLTCNPDTDELIMDSPMTMSGNLGIIGNGDLTMPNGDIILTGDITGTNCDANFDGDLTVGEDIFMGRNKRIQYNSDTYFYEYINDIVLKMGTSSQGGDYKMFRNNTPDSTAGNWEADLFINGGAPSVFEIWGGYGRSGYNGENVKIGNNIICLSTTPTICSDDRLKTEEVLITNATDTLMKLKPQTYMKSQFLGTEDPKELPARFDIEKNNSKKFEAGLIAQEIYYNCPELRHIVKRIGDNVKELPENMDIDDLQNDPDWNALGWNAKEASVVAYTELIPYLITSNQEQQTEIDTLKTELNAIKELLLKNNIV